MTKKTRKPVVELNDDIDWDYHAYQGRSRRQVASNETAAYYVVGASLLGLIGLLIYLVLA